MSPPLPRIALNGMNVHLYEITIFRKAYIDFRSRKVNSRRYDCGHIDRRRGICAVAGASHVCRVPNRFRHRKHGVSIVVTVKPNFRWWFSVFLKFRCDENGFTSICLLHFDKVNRRFDKCSIQRKCNAQIVDSLFWHQTWNVHCVCVVDSKEKHFDKNTDDAARRCRYGWRC